MSVDCGPHIRGILRDDALTRGLGDIEARMLVEWVAGWAELLSEAARNDDDACQLVSRLARRGRAIARFVLLWTDFDPHARGSACQLAASERFQWPLPIAFVEPPDLMRRILDWETQRHE